MRLLEVTGVTSPIDCFLLAAALGYTVVRSELRGSVLLGRQLFVDAHATERMQHELVAHELARVLLEQRHDIATPEKQARLARAIMLPYAVLRDELRRGATRGDLIGFHRFAPASAIDRRLAELGSGMLRVV